MEKRVRFGDLVRASGRPEVHPLWTDPENDREFTRAVRQKRVLTVLPQPGSKKKDFGEVGFHKRSRAIYLLFPRRLSPVTGARVTGINYELLEEPAVSDPGGSRAANPGKIRVLSRGRRRLARSSCESRGRGD